MKSLFLKFSTAPLFLLALALVAQAADAPPQVRVQRVPEGGIQPQVVVDSGGTVHLIFFKGDAASGDIFYCKAAEGTGAFSPPIRVNSQPGSAIATGTIRGAHLALGGGGVVHVAWNGSGKAVPKGLPNPDLPEDSPYRLSSPMLYSRLEANNSKFEPQRNLMTHTYSLDGGGSVAADSLGNVFVVWHANSQNVDTPGEAGRAVWVATSHDRGKTFAVESRANADDSGACGCCGLRAFVNPQDELWVLYRTAQAVVNRDMVALISKDRGQSFTSRLIDRWEVPQCVMSSAAVATRGAQTLAAWETQNHVKFGRVDLGKHNEQKPSLAMSGPSANKTPQKHPVLAANSQGQVLLAWTEGTGWQKGGELAWQVFSQDGLPVAEGAGRLDGIPVWSFPAAYVNKEGAFTILY